MTGKGISPVPVGSMDRRVARTRNLLQQALFKLTVEKGYSAVTVEDICREANVGRSTFYTHYPDKDRLRKAVIDEHIKTSQERGSERHSQRSAGGFSFSAPAFEHAHATRQIHRALVGEKKHDVPEEIRDWISDQVRNELASMQVGDEDGARLTIATCFIVGAFFEVMHWWLAEDKNISPEEIDQIFRQLSFKGVNAALGGSAKNE
jgi:AcrR family transcriptional regulator